MIYYFTPNHSKPSGGIRYLLRHALIASETNEVTLLIPKLIDPNTGLPQLFEPKWLHYNISKFNITYIDLNKDWFSIIKASDTLILPEGIGDIITVLSKHKCNKVVLAQSWVYIVNSFMRFNYRPWSDFGVTKVISISSGITDYIKALMPKIDVLTVTQGIDHEVFTQQDLDVIKWHQSDDDVVNVCYTQNRGPESEWKIKSLMEQVRANNSNIRFTRLTGLNQLDYAKHLREADVFLFTDDIAGFGTQPIEAMASGTLVLGFKSKFNSIYTEDDNGFWCDNGNYEQLLDIFKIFNIPQVTKDLAEWKIGNGLETSRKFTMDIERSEIIKSLKWITE